MPSTFFSGAYNSFFYRIWLHKVFIPKKLIIVDDAGEFLEENHHQIVCDQFKEGEKIREEIFLDSCVYECVENPEEHFSGRKKGDWPDFEKI